jgi:hypothetical protein
MKNLEETEEQVHEDFQICQHNWCTILAHSMPEKKTKPKNKVVEGTVLWQISKKQNKQTTFLCR